MQAQHVASTRSTRANSARRNPRTVVQQQRRGHPSRPVWQTGRHGGGESLQRRVATGSAWSLLDGMGTVGAGEVEGVGAATTVRGGCGLGTRGGM